MGKLIHEKNLKSKISGALLNPLISQLGKVGFTCYTARKRLEESFEKETYVPATEPNGNASIKWLLLSNIRNQKMMS